MLVAQGRLRTEGETYVPTADLSTLDVPETLTALIASRLDGLEPADRALVADAAVLGQNFTLAGLAAVSGHADERAGASPPGPRPARDPGPRGGPAQPGTRPIRFCPGAHPRGRLQHARAGRPEGPPPRRGPLLRVAGDRRAGRRTGRPLPRRPRQRRRGSRGRCAGRPGPHRPARRRGTGLVAGGPRPGPGLLRTGPVHHDGSNGGGAAPYGGGGCGQVGRTRRGCRPPLPGRPRAPPGHRGPVRPGSHDRRPRRGAPHRVPYGACARAPRRSLDRALRPG